MEYYGKYQKLEVYMTKKEEYLSRRKFFDTTNSVYIIVDDDMKAIHHGVIIGNLRFEHGLGMINRWEKVRVYYQEEPKVVENEYLKYSSIVDNFFKELESKEYGI